MADFIKYATKAVESRERTIKKYEENKKIFLASKPIDSLMQQFESIEAIDSLSNKKKSLVKANLHLCTLWHFFQKQKELALEVGLKDAPEFWDKYTAEILDIFRKYFTKCPAFYLDVMFAEDSIKSPLRNKGLKTIFKEIKNALTPAEIIDMINALHENLIQHTQEDASKPVYSIAFSKLDKISQRKWIVTSIRTCLTFFGSHDDVGVKDTISAFKNSWVAYLADSNSKKLGAPDKACQLPPYSENWSNYSQFEEEIKAIPIPGVMGADGIQDAGRSLEEVFQHADPALNGPYPGSPEVMAIAAQKFEEIQHEYDSITELLQELAASINTENSDLSLHQITMALHQNNKKTFTDVQQKKHQEIQANITALMPKMEQYAKALSKQVHLLTEWQKAIINKREQLAREIGEVISLYYKGDIIPKLQKEIKNRYKLLNAHRQRVLNRLDEVVGDLNTKYMSTQQFVAELKQEQRVDVSSISEAIAIEQGRLESNAAALQRIKQDIAHREAVVQTYADKEYTELPSISDDVISLDQTLTNTLAKLPVVKAKIDAINAEVDFSDDYLQNQRAARANAFLMLNELLNRHQREINTNIEVLAGYQQRYKDKQQSIKDLIAQCQANTGKDLAALTEGELNAHRDALHVKLREIQDAENELNIEFSQYNKQAAIVDELLIEGDVELKKRLNALLPIDNASLKEKIEQLYNQVSDMDAAVDNDYNSIKCVYSDKYKALEEIRIFRAFITAKHDEVFNAIHNEYQEKHNEINVFAQHLQNSIIALQSRISTSRLKSLPADTGSRKELAEIIANVEANKASYDFSTVITKLGEDKAHYVQMLDNYEASLKKLPSIHAESGTFYRINEQGNSKQVKLCTAELKRVNDQITALKRDLEGSKNFASLLEIQGELDTKIRALNGEAKNKEAITRTLNAELKVINTNIEATYKSWVIGSVTVGVIIALVCAGAGFVFFGGPIATAIGFFILTSILSGAGIGGRLAAANQKFTSLPVIEAPAGGNNTPSPSQALERLANPSNAAELTREQDIKKVKDMEVPETFLPKLVRAATLEKFTDVKNLTQGEPEMDGVSLISAEHAAGATNVKQRFLHNFHLGIKRVGSMVGLTNEPPKTPKSSPPISPTNTPVDSPLISPREQLAAATMSCPNLATAGAEPPSTPAYLNYNQGCREQFLPPPYPNTRMPHLGDPHLGSSPPVY